MATQVKSNHETYKTNNTLEEMIKSYLPSNCYFLLSSSTDLYAEDGKIRAYEILIAQIPDWHEDGNVLYTVPFSIGRYEKPQILSIEDINNALEETRRLDYRPRDPMELIVAKAVESIFLKSKLDTELLDKPDANKSAKKLKI